MSANRCGLESPICRAPRQCTLMINGFQDLRAAKAGLKQAEAIAVDSCKAPL